MFVQLKRAVHAKIRIMFFDGAPGNAKLLVREKQREDSEILEDTRTVISTACTDSRH